MTNALEIFKSAFRSIYPELSEAEWGHIVNGCEQITAPPKSILIEENKIQKHFFFLASGLVRGFYIDNKGEEITIRFIDSKGWATHYSALITHSPSSLSDLSFRYIPGVSYIWDVL